MIVQTILMETQQFRNLFLNLTLLIYLAHRQLTSSLDKWMDSGVDYERAAFRVHAGDNEEFVLAPAREYHIQIHHSPRHEAPQG